jgi:putative ABC transport system permease protein
MESLWNDLRFGLRSLRSAPATTAIALLALALGIGANSAIFSVVNGVLLTPLPYPRAERLVLIFSSNPKHGFPRFSASGPDFDDWHRQSRSFDGLAAISNGNVNLTGRGEPEVLAGGRVTADFFHVLGVRPLAGRFFRPDEDSPAGRHVAVLSQGLWQRRFGGDPAVVGQSLLLDGESYQVIGVAPPGLDFPRKRDLWVPLGMTVDKDSRGAHYFSTLGRLRDGVSLAAAQAEMKGITARLEQQYPDSNTGWSAVVLPLQEVQVEKVRPALLVLSWVVGAVLLIACLNVANLLLARLAARGREIAVRTALGAGRGRLVRQLLTESVLLALLGGLLGLLLAYWGTKALVALNPAALPRPEAVGLDGRVLAFTLVLSVAAGLVFGLFPALHDPGTGLHDALKEGGRAVAGGRRGRLARQGLALVEVALAVVLLVMAGVLLRSFARLSTVDPGFQPAGVLAIDLSPPDKKYPEPEQLALFYRTLLDRVNALPGVSRAGCLMPLPLSGGNAFLIFSVHGRPAPRPDEPSSAAVRWTSPGAFTALGIHLLRGRLPDERDTRDKPRVAVINRTMAEKIWPHEEALNQQITFGDSTDPKTQWMTVVGIVSDVKQGSLADQPQYEVYSALFQSPQSPVTLLARTAGDPLALAEPIRQAVREADPDLPVFKVRTMESVVAESLAQNRMSTVLLAIFAALALILAAVGVYGVISYSVAQRTHEMGIRMALGAKRGDVLGLVLRQGMLTVVVGLAVGILGAAYATRALSGLVYGVSTTDLATFLIVPLALAAVALLANYVPARRATRVDPLVALRQE